VRSTGRAARPAYWPHSHPAMPDRQPRRAGQSPPPAGPDPAVRSA